MSDIDASVPASIPSAWFCDRGGFWGTVNQLLLCAKCGLNEHKRHDQPRHYARVFTPHIHTICDSCFDTLPDDDATEKAA